MPKVFLVCRRNQKVFFCILCLGIVLLWQLLAFQPHRQNHHYIPVEELKTKPKRRLPMLRKGPEVLYQNNTPILVSAHQSPAQVEENFFRYIESKDVRCSKAQRLGHPHEGGWNVCLSPPYGFRKPCTVFSFGINNDWQFDESISIIYKCRVLSFDPSMGMAAHDRDEHIHFEPTGLGGKDEVNYNGWKLKTFRTYLSELNLSGTPIDYLKFDIEYSEWSSLEAMTSDDSLRNVRQIGFEIHTPELFRAFQVNIPTKKEDYLKMYEILKRLEDLGFRRYDHRRNPFGEFVSNISHLTRACCYELYYLNMRFFDEYQKKKRAKGKAVHKLFDDV